MVEDNRPRWSIWIPKSMQRIERLQFLYQLGTDHYSSCPWVNAFTRVAVPRAVIKSTTKWWPLVMVMKIINVTWLRVCFQIVHDKNMLRPYFSLAYLDRVCKNWICSVVFTITDHERLITAKRKTVAFERFDKHINSFKSRNDEFTVFLYFPSPLRVTYHV